MAVNVIIYSVLFLLPSSSWPHDVNMIMLVTSLLSKALGWWSFWCRCKFGLFGWCLMCGWCLMFGCCGFSLVISWSLECFDSKQLSGLESFEMAVCFELLDSFESLESWLLTVESGIIVCPSIVNDFLSFVFVLNFVSYNIANPSGKVDSRLGVWPFGGFNFLTAAWIHAVIAYQTAQFIVHVAICWLNRERDREKKVVNNKNSRKLFFIATTPG